MLQDQSRATTLFDFECWTNLINSQDWFAFKKLLIEHRGFLQRRVNAHLRKHEDRQAGEVLACLDDCDKILELISKRLNELKEASERGNG